MQLNWNYIKIAIVNLIVILELDLYCNQWWNLDGLESESITSRFGNPNRLSLIDWLNAANNILYINFLLMQKVMQKEVFLHVAILKKGVHIKGPLSVFRNITEPRKVPRTASWETLPNNLLVYKYLSFCCDLTIYGWRLLNPPIRLLATKLWWLG